MSGTTRSVLPGTLMTNKLWFDSEVQVCERDARG
jgi:hypothetical protein